MVLRTLGYLLCGVGAVLLVIATIIGWSISIELAKMQIEYLRENWILLITCGAAFISGVILLFVSE